MRRAIRIADFSVRHGPRIVLWNLAIAIFGFWSGLMPALIVYALTGATVAAALLVTLVRTLPSRLQSKEAMGFTRTRDLIAYEALDRGVDDNYYGLAIAGFLALPLSGARLPYVALVFASLGMAAAWAAATRRWPKDEPPARK